MTFSEVATTLENEAIALEYKFRQLIAQAARKHGGHRLLARKIGKSESYISNMIQQKQGMAALRKAAKAISEANI